MFPQSNNQTSSNVVRFTTTDDTINELLDLCPLNYQGLRTHTPTNLEIQDLASIFSTSPLETLKKIVAWRLNSCWTQEHLAQLSITELFGKFVSYSTQIPYKTKVTKTYSGQTVPVIGYATITFSYDPNGQFIFPLTVWITEMRTQNLLGMDLCQKQVSGIHFDLPGIGIKNPPKSIYYGSFHQNKSYPHLLQILTIRTPYTMCIDAKSARCWKYSPIDTLTQFPPGSTFQPNRNAVATGLSFINSLYPI